jgi:hypothetical protein
MLGKSKISLAGYDGYSSIPQNNYYSEQMILGLPFEVLDDRNRSVAEQIKTFQKTMQINFITPSIYSIKANKYYKNN